MALYSGKYGNNEELLCYNKVVNKEWRVAVEASIYYILNLAEILMVINIAFSVMGNHR